MNRSEIRDIPRSALEAMRRPGSFLREHMLRGAWKSLHTVSHEGLELKFVIPSRTCAYRASSFSTKEPETLRWIGSMVAEDVLWDVGANVGL